MDDKLILSRLHELAGHTGLPAQTLATPGAGWALDACRIGAVLRAVLLVESSLAVVSMFVAADGVQWVARLAWLTGAALPATLAWLVGVCLCKRWLARLQVRTQFVLTTALGAAAGVYGCWLLVFADWLDAPPPWVASLCAGALLSSWVFAALWMQARGRTPADTAARLTELQSRIRPHFLFNTLNNAIALVRAEPAQAESLLEDLSDLFRHALKDPGNEVTLGEELSLARRYLAIEQVRFGPRLQVQWELDPQADAALLPPLILQPLVENAVRHGVEPSPEGATVKISTLRKGTVVLIKVTNGVPAGPGPRGQGLALRNVQERLTLLHDVQGQFRSGLRNGVYQVRIEVPL